jgi:hypothetical protein
MSKKPAVILALVALLFVSCVDDKGKEELLKPYVDRLGNPVLVSEEAYPKITFFTYSWDGPSCRATIVVSKSADGWKVVRFDEQ